MRLAAACKAKRDTPNAVATGLMGKRPCQITTAATAILFFLGMLDAHFQDFGFHRLAPQKSRPSSRTRGPQLLHFGLGDDALVGIQTCQRSLALHRQPPEHQRRRDGLRRATPNMLLPGCAYRSRRRRARRHPDLPALPRSASAATGTSAETRWVAPRHAQHAVAGLRLLAQHRLLLLGREPPTPREPSWGELFDERCLRVRHVSVLRFRGLARSSGGPSLAQCAPLVDAGELAQTQNQ